LRFLLECDNIAYTHLVDGGTRSAVEKRAQVCGRGGLFCSLIGLFDTGVHTYLLAVDEAKLNQAEAKPNPAGAKLNHKPKPSTS
jgi:hypothetical protein